MLRCAVRGGVESFSRRHSPKMAVLHSSITHDCARENQDTKTCSARVELPERTPTTEKPWVVQLATDTAGQPVSAPFSCTCWRQGGLKRDDYTDGPSDLDARTAAALYWSGSPLYCTVCVMLVAQVFSRALVG